MIKLLKALMVCFMFVVPAISFIAGVYMATDGSPVIGVIVAIFGPIFSLLLGIAAAFGAALLSEFGGYHDR